MLKIVNKEIQKNLVRANFSQPSRCVREDGGRNTFVYIVVNSFETIRMGNRSEEG